MTLRTRLFLWLLLALGLLLVPLGFLTVREAQDAARATLERAALSRLGLLQAQGVSLAGLAGLVSEYGGVGFVVRGNGVVFTDSGEYKLPERLIPTLEEGRTYREIRGDTLWLALPGEEAAGLGVPLLEVAALPQRLLGIYLSVGGALALLAFGVGAWGLSRSLRPLEQVSQELARRNPDHLQPLTTPHLPEARPAVQAMNALMAELETALQQLKAQEQTAKRFAYGASHELRNPLAALRGYLEVLVRRPGEVRAVDGAIKQAERMQALLEGLLTLARLEGKGRVEGQTLDLDEWLAVHFPQVAREGRGQAVADPKMLMVAVENLIVNTQRHAGGVEKISLEPETDGVWLWVVDQGPGFPPGLLEGAFEAFVKRDSSDGVGLGLALVAAVAQVMGGKCRAENRAGGGARVGIWLPSS
ncbi:MAG: HAMP domain-containing sensor histidine kinase [Meiothermus sp.]|nr:HAMP domain-containing sensor histidine kinase [Meiothermus sp.]